MNNDEAVARINALEGWVCNYPKSNTFDQFRKDYIEQEREIDAFIATSDRDSWNQAVLDALDSLGETLDIGGFHYSRERPWRRIDQGPSYGDSRDDTLDELYEKLPADYQVSPAIAAAFDPTKQKLHSTEWVGKTRREQLDWLHGELQGLISRIQTPESAAVVHAYLFDFVDKYDVEGADLDVPL